VRKIEILGVIVKLYRTLWKTKIFHIFPFLTAKGKQKINSRQTNEVVEFGVVLRNNV
jgi:hypothetical protein